MLKLDFSSYTKSKNKRTAVKKYCDYLLDLDKQYNEKTKGTFHRDMLRYKISTYTTELIHMLVDANDIENLLFLISENCCTIPELLVVVAIHSSPMSESRMLETLLSTHEIGPIVKENIDLFIAEAQKQQLQTYEEALMKMKQSQNVTEITEKLKGLGLTKDMLQQLLNEGKL